MKKYIAFLILTLIISNDSFAQDYKTALGVRLSSAGAVVNNSVSLKQFISSNMAVEAMLSLSDPTAIGILAELHKPMGESALNWYYGAGAYIGFNSRTKFGAQGVIGLDYKFQNVPLNLSLDWKPELNFISILFFEPSTLGLTARFTFGK